MFTCPRCRRDMQRVLSEGGLQWRCGRCGGRAATISALRKWLRPEAVDALWQSAREGAGPEPRGVAAACPFCGGPMVRRRAGPDGPELDVCRSCLSVWFDAEEFEALPPLAAPSSPPTPPQIPLPPRPSLGPLEPPPLPSLPPPLPSEDGREGVFRKRLRAPDLERERRDEIEERPIAGWRLLPYLLGLPVRTAGPRTARPPLAAIAVALATLAASLYGFAHPEAVERFGWIPSLVADSTAEAVRRFFGSILLHADAAHLLGNLYYLFLFGPLAEHKLGRGGFLLCYLSSGLLGAFAHTWFAPGGDLPLIGASGCIAGLLAYCLCAFPAQRLSVLFYFKRVTLPAGLFASLWVLLQVFLAVAQFHGGEVSALAHLGGAFAGLAFLFWHEEPAEPPTPGARGGR